MAEAAPLPHLESGRIPRLVVLDLMMPVMDGWQFLTERQKDADVPVLVLTATRGIDAAGLGAMGAEDILQKPVAPENVLPAVRRYCPPN